MNDKLKYIALLSLASFLGFIKIVLFIFLFPGKYIFRFSSWGFTVSEKYQRYLFKIMDRLDFTRMEEKATNIKNTGQTSIKSDNIDIVGRTKTEFLKAFIDEEPKPIFSEELKTEDPVYEEPKIDPDDVDYAIDQVSVEKMLEDEELFDSHEGDQVSEDFSTGATIEELAETYDSLRKDVIPEKEAEKIVNVLNGIDGTDFFRFFTMNEMFAEKARMLLENGTATNSSPENQRGKFDFSKYIE